MPEAQRAKLASLWSTCGEAASLLPTGWSTAARREDRSPRHLDTSSPRARRRSSRACSSTILELSATCSPTTTSLEPALTHIPRSCAQEWYFLHLVAARRIPTGRAESCSGKGPSHNAGPGGPARQGAATGPACGRGRCACHTSPATSPASLSRRSSADHHSCPKGKPTSQERPTGNLLRLSASVSPRTVSLGITALACLLRSPLRRQLPLKPFDQSRARVVHQVHVAPADDHARRALLA